MVALRGRPFKPGQEEFVNFLGLAFLMLFVVLISFGEIGDLGEPIALDAQGRDEDVFLRRVRHDHSAIAHVRFAALAGRRPIARTIQKPSDC